MDSFKKVVQSGQVQLFWGNDEFEFTHGGPFCDFEGSGQYGDAHSTECSGCYGGAVAAVPRRELALLYRLLNAVEAIANRSDVHETSLGMTVRAQLSYAEWEDLVCLGVLLAELELEDPGEIETDY